jgi:hypothetical protein
MGFKPPITTLSAALGHLFRSAGVVAWQKAQPRRKRQMLKEARAEAAKLASQMLECSPSRDDRATRIQTAIVAFGHLCETEGIIFTNMLGAAATQWSKERSEVVGPVITWKMVSSTQPKP